MRYYDNGAFFTVTISRREVEDFAAHWPNFGERRAISFQFDKRNGDLVGVRGDQGSYPEAVKHLADDAQAFGTRYGACGAII